MEISAWIAAGSMVIAGIAALIAYRAVRSHGDFRKSNGDATSWDSGGMCFGAFLDIATD